MAALQSDATSASQSFGLVVCGPPPPLLLLLLLINLQDGRNSFRGCLCPFVPALIPSPSPGRVWVVGAAVLAQL